MIVVSDASPIIGLAAIGQLGLLRDLYDRTLIPEEVRAEVLRAPHRPGADELRAAHWIEVRASTPGPLFEELRAILHKGEAEALTLAVETHADLVLMDERRGRREAARLGLTPIGVLGVLIEAKDAEYIARVRPHLDALHTQAGFRFDDALRRRVLSAAGE